MLAYAIGAGLFLMVLERVIPDRKLPQVKGWWTRVAVINALQLGVVFLGMQTWDRWFQGGKLLHLGASLPAPLTGFLAYLIVTLVFYWWHRIRHVNGFLWLTLHQVHHSASRIETITSFYKHPVEIIANSLILGAINHVILGTGVDGAAFCLLYSSLGEYVYHMNIATPRWMGYFFQRPEMHRIHHQRGKHWSNFSDLPVWDMLFGTYKNPHDQGPVCGYKPEREARLLDMLAFRDVNGPRPAKTPAGASRP
jgi:sterol desaturase/sphingolipid hydroxylase (fatty acid hydroxylase superfamily)